MITDYFIACLKILIEDTGIEVPQDLFLAYHDAEKEDSRCLVLNTCSCLL